MNTGHAGSMSTGHSNGPRDMMSRLETMVMSAAEMPVQVIRNQIASALDIVIHLSRFRDRSRRVTDICEVVGMEEGEIVVRPLFQFEERGEEDGKVVGTLIRTEYKLQHTDKLRMAGIRLVEEDAVCL
ncbi:ATPase, T2SS/T4P/T4SS family [Paenibacillus glycanilyticus]|uniref:ATPase, T2SS/T4P/T4SS family n=1 Tax=Paenibacillus glycanilyticus TaxID=126569 RepID=UPI002889AE97|nr:ATPase, T2SS/T4P/T4SS family [Paenibacillus glycanilyticus]